MISPGLGLRSASSKPCALRDEVIFSWNMQLLCKERTKPILGKQKQQTFTTEEKGKELSGKTNVLPWLRS